MSAPDGVGRGVGGRARGFWRLVRIHMGMAIAAAGVFTEELP